MVDMDRQFPIPPPGGLDVPGVSGAFAYHMMYSVAKDAHPAKPYDAYEALAYAVRDRLMERWFRTQSDYYQRDAKRVYYLSLEFLIGRLLRNNIANLGARDAHARAMEEIGYRLEDLESHECDAALGNGGLGRLRAGGAPIDAGDDCAFAVARGDEIRPNDDVHIDRRGAGRLAAGGGGLQRALQRARQARQPHSAHLDARGNGLERHDHHARVAGNSATPDGKRTNQRRKSGLHSVTGTVRGASGQAPRSRTRAPSKASQLCAP